MGLIETIATAYRNLKQLASGRVNHSKPVYIAIVTNPWYHDEWWKGLKLQAPILYWSLTKDGVAIVTSDVYLRMEKIKGYGDGPSWQRHPIEEAGYEQTTTWLIVTSRNH